MKITYKLFEPSQNHILAFFSLESKDDSKTLIVGLTNNYKGSEYTVFADLESCVCPLEVSVDEALDYYKIGYHLFLKAKELEQQIKEAKDKDATMKILETWCKETKVFLQNIVDGKVN